MGHGEGKGAGGDGARRRLRGDEGAVLVEAAFVLPILVFLVFAIYAVCMGLNAKTELTGAVREGARTAAISAPIDQPALLLPVQTSVLKASPGLSTSRFTDWTISTRCNDPSNPEDISVAVKYEVPISVPFWRQTSFQLSSTAVVRCGL